MHELGMHAESEMSVTLCVAQHEIRKGHTCQRVDGKMSMQSAGLPCSLVAVHTCRKLWTSSGAPLFPGPSCRSVMTALTRTQEEGHSR
jgi:hypothetical protein